jgi:hypothetical protein
MADETQVNQDVPVDLTGGLKNGDEVADHEGNATGEKIVHETDNDGNVSGWHKEAL